MNIVKVHCLFAWLILLLFSGCTPSAYLTASGNYAKAMNESISTIKGMKNYNAEMCQQRMRLDYLFHRIEDKKLGKNPIYWANYPKEFRYVVKQTDGTSIEQNWNTHCKQIQVSSEIVNNALSELSTYANAINIVATKDYSGSDMKSLVNDTIDLAGKLNMPSKPTDIAKTLTNPIQQLAGILMAKYVKNEINKIIREAEPSVTMILDRTGNYIDALLEEQLDIESLMEDAINSVDSGLTGDSMEILQFNELASLWINDLQVKKEALQTLSGALKKLKGAQSALAKAGNQLEPDNAEELKTVLGNVVVVIDDIQAVNNAIQGKGGTSK